MRLREITRRTGFRWGLTAAALLAGGTLLVFGLVYWLAISALSNAVNKSVLEQLQLLSERPPSLLPFMISSRMQAQPSVITLVGLFDKAGRPLVGDIRAIPTSLQLDGRTHEVTAAGEPGQPPTHLRAAGRRLARERILIVARPNDGILAARQSLFRALAISLAPATAICIAVGVVAGAGTQRRLVRLRTSAERIMEGRLDERLPTRIPGDDLDELATLVNLILGRLQELFTAVKGAGEDIAHDIRTPLTRVRARLERVRDGTYDSEQIQTVLDQTIAGIDQVLTTVTALLRIAEIEKVRRHSGFCRFDLAEATRDIAEAYRPVGEDSKVTLLVETPGPAPILGDRDLLVEALANLIDNAIKFTPAGGTVSVAITGTPTRPLVRIADNGPGIAEHERDMVVRRFYRADRSRGSPGTGLGLSLVRAVVNLHRFGLSFGDNHPGCIVELSCWGQD